MLHSIDWNTRLSSATRTRNGGRPASRAAVVAAASDCKSADESVVRSTTGLSAGCRFVFRAEAETQTGRWFRNLRTTELSLRNKDRSFPGGGALACGVGDGDGEAILARLNRLQQDREAQGGGRRFGNCRYGCCKDGSGAT